MYGADPRLRRLGSKTGCRRLFAEVGVPYPLGAEDLHSVDEVVDAIDEHAAARPALRQVIVKLNEGVSGAGQRAGRSRRAADAGAPDEARCDRERAARDAARGRRASRRGVPGQRSSRDGGIVEERIIGEALPSPSVQLRVLPDGSVELLSTHDQLLGGASGQSYLGCIFPGRPGVRRA